MNVEKKTKHNTNCCVPQCHSKASKDPFLSFHKFPRNNEKTVVINLRNVRETVDRRKEWLRRLRIGKKISNRMVVCSKHFRKEDFFPGPGKYGKVRRKARLKLTAVPTLYLPLLSTDKKGKIEKKNEAIRRRQERYRTRICLENKKCEPKEYNDSDEKEVADALLLLSCSGSLTDTTQFHRNEVVPSATFDRVHNSPDSFSVNEHEVDDSDNELPTSKSFPNCKDLESASSSRAPISSTYMYVGDNLRPRINYNKLTNKELKTLTGIPNSLILDKLTHLLVTKEFQLQRSLTVKEQIVMTMMRIKINLKFTVLSIFFGVTRTTCKKIFVITVSNLKRILQSCVVLPSKEDTVKTLPKCFLELQDVRLVADCTEISVEKTKCLTCSINTYSVYKGCNTIKYMIFMSPDGLVSHVSKGYGGRASDKLIFRQSGILEFLEPHVDSILVDKGFLIEEECYNSYIRLIRPPFVKNGKLSATDARRTRIIARARVHVERIIQRLKMYELLRGRVPWSLVPFIDDIMIIVSGLTNLSFPILADKRF